MTLGLSAAAEGGAGEGSEGSGGLPAGWARATLGELGVEVQSGFASGKHNRDGDGIVHLRPMNITRNGAIDLSDARYVMDESDRRVEYGDVIFNNTNSPALVGKTAWFGSLEPAAYSNHMTRLRGPEGLDSKFLAMQLHWLWFSGYFKTVLNNHVNQASVARKVLLATEIVVPPLSEQLRIVSEVEQQIARIEAGEASVRSAEEMARSLWLAVLESIVEAGSTSESHLKTVGEVATVSGGIQKSGKRRPSVNPYPFLRVANVSRGALNLSDVHEIELFEGEIDRYRLVFGDLLVVEGNGSPDHIGRGSTWRDEIPDCVHQNHLIRVRPGDSLLADYLELIWNAPSTSKQLKEVAASTSGLYTLSTAKIKRISVPVPSLAVQEELVNQARNHRAVIDAAAVTVTQASDRAQDLRASLLHAAFTGALVPQDPADEPASVMLDRIRAAQGAKAPRKRAARKPRPTPPGQEELPS
ncbi:restriction endonuclease subunit S [Streptomyces cellulosae]